MLVVLSVRCVVVGRERPNTYPRDLVISHTSFCGGRSVLTWTSHFRFSILHVPKYFNSVLYAVSISLNVTCGFKEVSVLFGMKGHCCCFSVYFIRLLCETMYVIPL